MEKTLKIIEAIGKQWPFLIVVFTIILFILKWKTIWDFVASISQIKIKSGDNEIELNKDLDAEKTEVKEKQGNQIKEIQEVSVKQEEVEETNIRNNYQQALDDLKFGDAKKIYEKLLEKETDENLRKRSKISNFYWRHIHGDTSAFEELEKYITIIDNNDKIKPLALYNLSRFYSDSNNYEKSLKLLNEAVEIETDENERSRFISRISEIHYDADDKTKSIDILFNSIDKAKERTSLSLLYNAVASYYKKENNKLLESVAYQKALECKPNDITKLFDTAYSYSEVDDNYNDLGLLFYKKLLYVNPSHQSALNNIGVSYRSLKLNLKSIEYYQKAFEKKSTLAAANLAYQLINSGFRVEAEEYISKANEMEDIHDSVFSAASNLKQQLKSENESEERIISKAEKKYRFFNFFGKASFTSNLTKIESSKNWLMKDLNVKIKTDDDTIIIDWEKGEEKHNLSGSIEKNALHLIYKKPKKKTWSSASNDKYTYTNHKGYGYIEDSNTIVAFFIIDKEIEEFIIKTC